MMTAAVVAGLVILTVAFFGWRPRSALVPESLLVVSFDEKSIAVAAPGGENRSIEWASLTRVGIRTTHEGPQNPDVFWGFHAGGEEPTVAFPGGATGERELIAAMQSRLAEFNNEELVKAMGTATNAYFVIWERGPGPGAGK